jgi:hypothetical protein
LECSLCNTDNQSSDHKAGQIDAKKEKKKKIKWTLPFPFIFSIAFINYNLPILSMAHQVRHMPKYLLKHIFTLSSHYIFT